MICKFCNAEVAEDHKFCPYCGKDLFLEETEVEELPQLPEEPAVEATEEKKRKHPVWPYIVGGAGTLVLLGLLALVLLYAFGVDLTPKANDIYNQEVYTVSDDVFEKKGDKVIAKMGGKELTNKQLQIFYRMQVADFVNYYGEYLSYVSMDITKPLSEQTCPYDESMTWEQYFLDVALETWQNYQAVGLLAEEAGYTLSEEWQTALDEMPAQLEGEATSGGYENADELIQDVIGPGCTLDEYLKYIELAFLRNDYYGTQYESLMPTDAEVEAYFAENAAEYEESGVTQDSGLLSNVRHILICPEGGTEDEDGNITYSEEEWAACLAEAEALLEKWRSGEATEESFSALATEHTADTASADSGGLYEGIYLGSGMVEEFEAWAIDETRQAGDVGIVKTQFGYHIMYFVSGVPNWFNVAQTNLLADRTTQMIEDAKEKWPMEITYRKISLAELDFE